MRLRLVALLAGTLATLFLYQNCGKGSSKGTEVLSSLTQSIVDENGNYRLPDEVPLDPSLSPTVYLRNAETNVGEDANFEILLNKTLSVVVQIRVETFDGSAVAGVHYQTTSKTLKIAPGQKAIILPVPTLGSAELLEPVVFGLRIVESSIPIGQGVSGGLIQSLQSPLELAKIESATFHSCGLDPDGKAWCWGYNRLGQLGAEIGTSQVIPTPVQGNSTYTDLALGNDNSCGIRSDGFLECWGGNTMGQLGSGSLEDSFIPTVPLNLPPVKSVSVGYRSICAVTLTNQLYCWGQNSNQMLGLNSTQPMYMTPTLVRNNISSVSLNFHGCAISTTNQLLCWGLNSTNRLARADTTLVIPIPTIVPGMPNGKKVLVASGSTCVQTLGDEVQCVGYRLGVPTTAPAASQSSDLFYGILGLESVSDFSLSSTHGCGLAQSGDLRCWGSNRYGELGRDTPSGNFDSGSQSLGSVTDLRSFSTGAGYTCIVSNGNEGRCWGSNAFGRLGNNPASNSLTARLSEFSQVSKIAQSFSRACIINSKKEVQCIVESGPDSGGDDGAVSYVNLTTVPGLGTVKDISVGGLHACAVDTAGEAHCWGYNNAGQLGSNIATSRSPVQVPGIISAEKIFSNSGGRTCVIHQDQSVTCWGNYSSIGSNIPDGVSPLKVPLFQGALKLAMGSNHTCALLTNGRVRCLGSNSHGQLGDGLTNNETATVPVDVVSTDQFTDISAGARFTCGVLAGGKAKCWGANDRGQLGQNTDSEESVTLPQAPVANLSAIRKIYSSSAQSCAIVAGNRPFCWGDNTGWKLGILEGGIASAPLPVTSVYNVHEISLASTRSYYVKLDGSVRVAGARPANVNRVPITPISVPKF